MSGVFHHTVLPYWTELPTRPAPLSVARGIGFQNACSEFIMLKVYSVCLSPPPFFLVYVGVEMKALPLSASEPMRNRWRHLGAIVKSVGVLRRRLRRRLRRPNRKGSWGFWAELFINTGRSFHFLLSPSFSYSIFLSQLSFSLFFGVAKIYLRALSNLSPLFSRCMRMRVCVFCSLASCNSFARFC